MTFVEEQLIPLAEFFGIPVIIITPIVLVLFVLFKYLLPKLLNNNSRLVGRIVISILAQLFGEGEEDEPISGVKELSASKVIKNLPDQVASSVNDIAEDNIETIEVLLLIAQAVMDERLIKPQNDTKLREAVKKGNALINKVKTRQIKSEIEKELKGVEDNDEKIIGSTKDI